jgi:hypothetical protein
MMDPNSNAGPDDADQPIAWRAALEDTPVRSGGKQVGTLFDLLGSHEEDIFHGIVVQLQPGSRHVFVPADDVDLITSGHVDVSLTAAELAGLPEHTEERQYQLGIAGTFRKRAGWIKEKDR